MNSSTDEEPTLAEVTHVFQGKKPYAVAWSKKVKGSVTFSLDLELKVWEGEEVPKAGTFVVLTDLRKNAHGWRAHHARFMRPEDEAHKQ